MEKAVIDRIVEGLAVVLVGESEEEFHVPVDQLPTGAKEGSRLSVRVAKVLAEIVLDQDETDAAAARIQEKLDRLRQRGRSR